MDIEKNTEMEQPFPYYSFVNNPLQSISRNSPTPADLRTCLHKKCVRIFEHKFVADKAKIRSRAVARQEFLTQSAAKFAEKTCTYACEDRF